MFKYEEWGKENWKQDLLEHCYVFLERQGYAQQGGIEHATERLAREILGIELAGHEGVHQACQQKAQQQVGRHAGNQINNFLHTYSKNNVSTCKGTPKSLQVKSKGGAMG